MALVPFWDVSGVKPQMKITVQPAKRTGGSKSIFSGPVKLDEAVVGEIDGVAVTFVAADIYTKGSSLRYTISLSKIDIDAICKGVPD